MGVRGTIIALIHLFQVWLYFLFGTIFCGEGILGNRGKIQIRFCTMHYSQTIELRVLKSESMESNLVPIEPFEGFDEVGKLLRGLEKEM